MNISKKIQKKITAYLSHYPTFYALVVGIGIVLFWRGVWHTADEVHLAINHFSLYSSISFYATPWWDGPFSFVVGTVMLYLTGAFTSSFIGNELILSGLRGERKLSERAEIELKNEENTISDIKDELVIISKKLEILEHKANTNHKNL